MEFPEGIQTATLFDLYEKYHIAGDKKMMYRTDICKKYPCPVYLGEKYYPNRHKYYMIDREAPCILLRKPVCVVEYLPDGITASRYKRYLNNPVGLAAYRLFLMECDPRLKNIVRQSIHFIAKNLISNKNTGLANNPHKVVHVCMIPFGIALYIKIKQENHKRI